MASYARRFVPSDAERQRRWLCGLLPPGADREAVVFVLDRLVIAAVRGAPRFGAVKVRVLLAPHRLRLSVTYWSATATAEVDLTGRWAAQYSQSLQRR